MAPSATPSALVADIGGTNTRVALARDGAVEPNSIRRFANAEHPGLAPIVTAYLAEQHATDLAGACVAAAGPVRDGVAQMTNLDWTIDGDTLAAATGAAHVAILNDLQAQGHAVGAHAPGTVQGILPGAADTPTTPALVIGVGTGFNAAPVHDMPEGRLVAPSECGHANLPIRSEADMRLCQFVDRTYGFPAIEEMLSGRGIEHVYAWLGEEAGDPRTLRSTQIMAALEAGSDPRAAEAADVFVRLLGTVAGNLALIHLPFGGIYLVGGMSRAITPRLSGPGFAAAFRDKGRFAGFMDSFPVCVVEDDYAALTGCARHLAAVMARG